MFGLSENRNGFGTFSGPNGSGSAFSSGTTAWVSGTIAYIMARYGMDVIDSGVAVLSMHSLWEVTSKADIYEAYRGYKAFIERP